MRHLFCSTTYSFRKIQIIRKVITHGNLESDRQINTHINCCTSSSSILFMNQSDDLVGKSMWNFELIIATSPQPYRNTQWGKMLLLAKLFVEFPLAAQQIMLSYTNCTLRVANCLTVSNDEPKRMEIVSNALTWRKSSDFLSQCHTEQGIESDWFWLILLLCH